MESRLVVQRVLPSGRQALVRPFHLSLEGLKSSTVCRDEEDYDVMVKSVFLCARRHDVIVVIYAVVSNHAHIAVLSEELCQVERFANNLKQVHSMWLSRKYGGVSTLLGTRAYITAIETVQYARNVFAYIPRNALDNGAANIATYKWSAYRAMFCKPGADENGGSLIPVKNLSRRCIRQCFHTGDKLTNVPWMLNGNMELEPASACDCAYLESVFNNDQSFFMRLVGSANMPEMTYDLSIVKNERLNDASFIKLANEYAGSWYRTNIYEMSPAMKARFLAYLSRKLHLRVPQVARCLEMDREIVAKILGK